MPLVIIVCCVVVEVYLFPENCFGVLCGYRIMDCFPYIIPIYFTSKVFLPFFAMMVFFIGTFDQPIIYELMCDHLKPDVFVLYFVIKSIFIPMIDVLIFDLEVYPGYAFPVGLLILLAFIFI